jgi:hypothetical protein
LLLDEYERRARLTPGLLVLLPLAVFILSLGMKNWPVSGLLGLLTAVGGPIVLADLVRQKGLALQHHLYGEWGGPPTTLKLRLAKQDVGDVGSLRQRARIAALTGALPTAEQEAADPEMANSLYKIAVAELRERTRDKTRFPVVFAENKNYGFARNLLGIRPIGIALAASVIGLASFAELLTFRGIGSLDPSSLHLGIVVDLAILVFWIAYPSEDKVRRAADLYAERLLDALLVLDTVTSNGVTG